MISDHRHALTRLLEATATRSPDAVAVHHNGRDWRYSELARSAAAIGGWLVDHGLRPGERVGLLVGNSLEYIAGYFGTLMAGGIVVGLNPDTTSRELARTLGHCEAAAIIVHPRHAGLLERASESLSALRIAVLTRPSPAQLGSVPLVSDLERVYAAGRPHSSLPEAEPQEVAQILYTSGTMGHPKGVTLSHRNLLSNCDAIVRSLRLTGSDSVLVTLPFSYSYGNSVLLTHVAVGGRLIVPPDLVFWNRALDLLERQRATGFSGVPASFAILLERSNFAARRLEHLRYLTCAGGALAPSTIRRLREAAPHARLFVMYGQTEASARLSILRPEELDRKLGSIGMGIPGVKLTVVSADGHAVRPGEIGEIVAEGDNVMVGYWKDPAATRRVVREGRLYTGDLARIDEDGYIFVVGREGDLIKCGAHRIDPRELEEAIMELDGVAEVAVTGRADRALGHVPVAYVVPARRRPPVSAEDVLAHCARLLPRFKTVRQVLLVDALPRTSSGKLRRVALGTSDESADADE